MNLNNFYKNKKVRKKVTERGKGLGVTVIV